MSPLRRSLTIIITILAFLALIWSYHSLVSRQKQPIEPEKEEKKGV